MRGVMIMAILKGFPSVNRSARLLLRFMKRAHSTACAAAHDGIGAFGRTRQRAQAQSSKSNVPPNCGLKSSSRITSMISAIPRVPHQIALQLQVEAHPRCRRRGCRTQADLPWIDLVRQVKTHNDVANKRSARTTGDSHTQLYQASWQWSHSQQTGRSASFASYIPDTGTFHHFTPMVR